MTTRNGASIPTEAGGSGAGSGTVTSVDAALPLSVFSASSGAVTTSGTLTFTFIAQVANKVFAGPTTGADATPTFRVLVAADIPDLSSVYQPLDADLTAIAAVATQATGRSLLTATSISSPITFSAGVLDFDETATLGNNARVAVSKNSGATVGTRRRINFIEGSNVTLTVADDSGNEEVDVTIASSGSGSGLGVVEFIREVPPGTIYATDDIRVGGSTPAEGFPVADFDDTTIEYRDYLCRLRGYQGGGLTFVLGWAATSATSGNVVWDAAIRALPDDTEDMDASHTYDFNSVTAAAASASGELSYDSITFTDGADMDSLADGEFFILRLRRNASDGSDTMTGDAEVLGLVGAETP